MYQQLFSHSLCIFLLSKNFITLVQIHCNPQILTLNPLKISWTVLYHLEDIPFKNSSKNIACNPILSQHYAIHLIEIN